MLTRRGFFGRLIQGAALAFAANYTPSLLSPERRRNLADRQAVETTLLQWHRKHGGASNRVVEMLSAENELFAELPCAEPEGALTYRIETRLPELNFKDAAALLYPS